jgi:hypothetical protein
MALTKASSVIDACAEIAQNAVREGALIDLTDSFEAALGIQLALTDETAHASGTQVLVQVLFNTAGDEDWVTYHAFLALAGTAACEALADDPHADAGLTELHVASTTGYAAAGVLCIFIEDVDVFANSEWLRLVEFSSNHSITLLDGTVRQHAKTSQLSNLASTHRIALPFAAQKARVVYDNTMHGAAGSTVACRTLLHKVTAVS